MTEPVRSPEPALEVVGLAKTFHQRSGGVTRAVQAVTDVSFRVAPGKTLGIVGESGCGKSTTARLVMGLIEPDRGDVLLAGREVGRSTAEVKAFRRRVQMVFQDSAASLNPRLTIEASIMFGPVVHGLTRTEARARTHRLLDRVGLDPARFAGRYPHEVSGGQRQRVNIARALAMEPDVVILDESVSALDKSIEAQVLGLLADLQAEMGLTYIFISHDLNVVRWISDEVMVMYLGRVVEIGPAEAIFEAPAHPYTRALLASMPSLDPEARTLTAPISGDPPSPIDPPSGCRFHPRCVHAAPICTREVPEFGAPSGAGRLEDIHRVACHMAAAGASWPERGATS
jgi:peptide/nickel transport system ATP-binding protein